MSALAAGCSAALLGIASACGGTDTTTGTTSGAQKDGGSTGGAASGSGAATGSGGAINGSGSTSSGAGGTTPGAGGTAQGGRAGAGTSGMTGNGGSTDCPPTCFVNNECVETCGGTPRDFGCCPCPAGTINVFSCGAGGASGGSGGASGGGTSCDPRRALCRALPPNCPTGQVASISGSCWGDCVPIATCQCTAAEDCPDPNQYTCHRSRGVCDYYVN